MSDKVFIDTNLLIYAVSTDAIKSARVADLLQENFEFYVSTQVINEFVHTCLRKELFSINEVKTLVDDYLLFFQLITIDQNIISTAFEVKRTYQFSWYDALIVAAAYETGCRYLYSEDMQHGMVVHGKMTIQNPFTP